MCVHPLFRLSVRLSVNSRLLVVKFSRSQNLYMPLTPASLRVNCKYCTMGEILTEDVREASQKSDILDES